jgi:branched-chain amino acid transport system substrate-binding protein
MRPQPVRFLSFAAATLVATSMLAGCGSGGGTGTGTQSGSPIVIGASLSLTGAFSSDGQAFQRGYQLWQSDVNSHGGILGRQVKLIILNDNSSPTQVVSNYQQLITVDHVDLTFGPFSSLLTAPASVAVHKDGYALVEGAGGAPIVFSNGLNNVFDVSLPVASELDPLVAWIKSMPPALRPKTAAYPMAIDPFADPPVLTAQKALQAIGIRTVYSRKFAEKVSAYRAPADQVAASNAQIVVLGSTDVPTVSTFMQAFEQQHYQPEIFIAASGPDQGIAFLGTVGQADATGVMVPDGWYGAYSNPLSYVMVEEYIARYGGTSSDINADVAEAYSVGEVVDQAVTHDKSLSNTELIAYLHSDVTLQSAQGPVQFNKLGENQKPAAFVFQWQNGSFNQVLPAGAQGSSIILYPKPHWNG